MTTWRDDYTRSRDIGNIPYSIDDIIGKKDSVDRVNTISMVVSGTATRLPGNPLGRRNYIHVVNMGGVDVSIISSLDNLASEGIIIKAGGDSWEEYTDAKLYIISTGAESEVRVYERAKVK